MSKLEENMKLFILCGTFLIGLVANSQTYISNEKLEPLLLEDEALNQSAMENLRLFENVNSRNAELRENEVFLKQIGSFNEANIRTQSQYSEINLTQDGDRNVVDVNYQVNTAVADLVQKGYYNSIKDYVDDPSADISLKLTQEGSFMQFERNGINELTKSLKFEQNEFATPYIIIRSY